jgi:DnaJ-class molecular chaperone
VRRQPSDPPPKCGQHPDADMFVEDCGACGGEGRVSRHEEDPLWFDEKDLWPCSICEGRGWLYECQRCLDGEPESVRNQPAPRSGT